MILISNHLQNFMELPKEAVIRINMAWVKDLTDLEFVIINNAGRIIYLDYPQNRKKFPQTILGLDEAYYVCHRYGNIHYFAVSNVEEIGNVASIQSKLPTYTEFVPKIETKKGVDNLENLIRTCAITTIMLDKEDLLVDLNKDNTEFYKCVEHVREVCKGLNVELLELQGVVFIGATDGIKPKL